MSGEGSRDTDSVEVMASQLSRLGIQDETQTVERDENMTGGSSSTDVASPISSLPPELVYRIFSFILCPTSLTRAELVCHQCREIISSQALWRQLALHICGPRILPERVNELGKGSLVNGRWIPDGDGGGRWNYLYRDLIRNIQAYRRISDKD